MKSIIVVLSISRFFDNNSYYCYYTYKLICSLINLYKQYREYITLLYIVEYKDFDAIFDILIVKAQDILINFSKKTK